VWDSAGRYEAGRAQPFTWLQTIARNAAIDSLRRQHTETLNLAPLPEAGPDDDEHPLARQPSPAPGPAELLEQAWDAQDVRGCMAQLESPQRHSLALAFYDGLSHAEVASHLGQPLGTVKSWLRRSLQALQRCLAACGHTAAAPGSPTTPA
jgi:RNA polymerase sigma-70 factor (ECF subfamily)